VTRVAEVTTTSFGDRLTEHVRRRQSQIVLGLDPDPARLWPRAVAQAGGPGGSGPPAQQAADAVARHCRLVIAAVAEHCVAVKPQLACFERLGAPGWGALAATVEAAREAGLLVIADGKRGDIDVSAAAYAAAYFGATPTPYGAVPGLGVDALTVNPYLGVDALEPFLRGARAASAGLFVLARTSNPGAVDIQELMLPGGDTVADRVARLIGDLGASGLGAHGLSDIGAVVGATAPQRLAALRALMPRTPFLLPGIGHQGGRIEDLAPVFAAGPAGGLAALSRSLVQAHTEQGGEPADAAAREAARVRGLAWSLAAAST
jgi:orotidine-5'-phosphate decarboxylase